MQYSRVGASILYLSTRYVVARGPRWLPLSITSRIRCSRWFAPRRQKSTDSSPSSPDMSPKIEYNWIRGVESLEDYTTGGYHPVNIGDKLHGRYFIIDKLGFGGYSTVWLARDLIANRYVALKVGIANSDAPVRETKIIEALSRPSSSFPAEQHPVPFILDKFKIDGPNGTHPCCAMTPARGDLRQAREIDIFPLDVARTLCGRLTLAVAYMHSRGYVHGG